MLKITTNNFNKSVSKLLNKKFKPKTLITMGIRGRFQHEALSGFNKKVFKNPNRNRKTNYRVFSQGITKAYNETLENLRMAKDYELYYEDAKILLNTLRKNIIYAAKELSKQNNYVVIPEEVEKALFSGETEFESEAVGKIGGIKIPARADIIIDRLDGTFVIREFKSYILEQGDDPRDPDSDLYRDFMQVCLYGIIFEQDRAQKCMSVELMYFPDKILTFAFTDELRELAIKFAMDTAFEGFEGITFDFYKQVADTEEIFSKERSLPADPGIPPNDPKGSESPEDHNEGELSLGWINTIKGKPFQINRGKDDKLEGYLYANTAEQVRANSLLKVVTDNGSVLGCKVEKIECFEYNVSGETASHKEENYKILLNPEVEFSLEGVCDVRPQTIISGKIKKLTIQEFYLYKKIPQNGVSFGIIVGLIDQTPYPLNVRLLYQSVFMGGVQGTGKTSTLRYLMMKVSQQSQAPAQIIFDAEEEYINLPQIPTSQQSAKNLIKHEIKRIDPKKFDVITFGSNSNYCLTLKGIDPLDLPLFLHELTSITHNALQRIIKDITTHSNKQTFTFPELKQLILDYLDKPEYRLNVSTKSAIERALMPISLDLFDTPKGTPIDVPNMIKSGKITVINCFNTTDEEQKLIALFLLCAFHKYKMKLKNQTYDSGILFYLDEVQRLLPKLHSSSENQKRIIHYLGEIHHRGRKRYYGVIYATQSPLDIKKDIIDLCVTKLFFQIQGDASNLLREYLHKEDRERLKRLPVGQAFITCKGKHEPVEIKFPFID